MLELNQLRKNKISLEDYDYKQDIENRLMMAQFSSQDLEVLEEIIYSSIKIPIRKLGKTVDLEDEQLLPILEKFSTSGLCSINDDSVLIDKDVRKYFESQILKFDPDFKPGMEFLQNLLKKVPIHILPVWYSIPRTSNNIFESLIEKYLLTPQIFQRYLVELNFTDPTLSGMVQDVYNAPDFKMDAQELIEKHKLSRQQFEEHLLHLEFNFVCCLGYEKVDHEWKEIVTPFHEWKEYMSFLRDTEVKPISSPVVQRKRPQDFSFILDMTILLQMTKKQPITLTKDKEGRLLPSQDILSTIAQKIEDFEYADPAFLKYFDLLRTKICLLKLADVVDGRLYALEAANDWLDMRVENRALFIHRHPLNKLISDHVPQHLCTERNMREAEKSICRVLHSGWVYFDDFLKGVIVPLGEESIIMLKKQGKSWKYTIPTYSEDELMLIKATALNWLFEMGVTAVGTHDSKDCFCVTPFGQSLFGR